MLEDLSDNTGYSYYTCTGCGDLIRTSCYVPSGSIFCPNTRNYEKISQITKLEYCVRKVLEER